MGSEMCIRDRFGSDGGTHCIDTHDGRVIDPVWDLYAEVHRRAGNRATLLEWDANIPSFDEVHAEVMKAAKFRDMTELRHAS